MWDFSWLLRHDPGEFSDWDHTLDELAERGYDAIRIDAFPQWVAAGSDGVILKEFSVPKNDGAFASWGPASPTAVRPREALLEFLPKCRERGIRVGLSSWFQSHDTLERNRQFVGVTGLVRAWSETLAFLDSYGLLHDCLYVDVLNEYPLWHEFTWFKDEMKKRATHGSAPSVVPAADAPAFMWNLGEPSNDAQRIFTNAFIRETIAQLSAKWPALPFFASFSYNENVPWQDVDLSGFGALDMHVWLVHHPSCFKATGYLEDIHPLKTDARFVPCQEAMRRWWKTERNEVIEWMDAQLAEVAATGIKHGIPCGNTEGWGPINWTEHSALPWDFVKEAGEICVGLARKHDYKFICTSNFTHPQFPGIWRDIAWHQQLTDAIKRPL